MKKMDLAGYLKKHNIWNKLIESKNSTRTVEESSRVVNKDKIVKSLIFLDINGNPFLVILLGTSKANFKKIKKTLGVRDVTLANAEEVLKFSGYNVGEVPPIKFGDIEKVIVDKKILEKETIIGGGGKSNRLIELNVKDIIKLNNPIISDISN